MSVTAAAGFRASGVTAGLKESGTPDVALVVNDGPQLTAAGVVTSNTIKAAPVLWTQQCLTTGELRAVILNSGGANACTGPAGFQDTHTTAEYVAELLECGAIEVGVCSTGLIGVPLDMAKLLPGCAAAAAELASTEQAGQAAATAIMTTDSVRKTAVARGNGVTVGGMVKGAGMLAPGMATMLSVLTTDAVLTPAMAQELLTEVVDKTYNRVDSDGCMSTNDTVLLLASGASGQELGVAEFRELLTGVANNLCEQLLADAEGASKEIAITVAGATDEESAVVAARSVARSNLFKAAMFGEDPNWGRIISAVGASPARFQANDISVAVNGVWVCRGGGVGEDRELVDMSSRKIEVLIELGAGDCAATVWTNDLTHDYVHENSAYST